MEISVVIPVYNAEKILTVLRERLVLTLESLNIDFEIILVEDGSSDGSWNEIEGLCEEDNRLRGIKLSRNFGQHHAITAGLDTTIGNWIVVMDCDLQDQPEEIAKLYKKAISGYNIVFARRAERQDTYLKKYYSRLFYRIFRWLSGIDQEGAIGNFGIYSKKVIKTIIGMREPLRAFSPMAQWVGYKTSTVDVTHAKRYSGDSTYNWHKLINLAFDIIMSYSDKPLKIMVKTGLFISFGSMIFALYNIVLFMLDDIAVDGYASLIVSIWFLSGLLILMMGILGMYIGKIFEGVKQRPLYIVEEKVNDIKSS